MPLGIILVIMQIIDKHTQHTHTHTRASTHPYYHLHTHVSFWIFGKWSIFHPYFLTRVLTIGDDLDDNDDGGSVRFTDIINTTFFSLCSFCITFLNFTCEKIK